MSNDVEIVVTSSDRSEAGLRSAESKVETFKRNAIKKIEEINAKEIKLKADLAQAEANLEAFKRKAQDIRDLRVKVDADIATATAEVDRLRKLAGGVATMEVQAKIDKAEANLQRLETKARQLASQDNSVKFEADTAAAEAKIDNLKRQLNNIPDERVKIDVDTDAAIRKVNDVDSAAKRASVGKRMEFAVDTGASVARIAAIGTALMQLVPLAMAAAGALAGLGAVGAVGFGAVAAGFNGIGDAMKAMGEKATGGGGAVKASAAEIQSATRQVEQAERDLAKAQEDEKTAQADLSRARQDAADDLRELQRATEDMALSQEGASISLERAKERLNELDKDGKASSLDYREARFRVAEAEQRLKETNEDAIELSKNKAEADKKGVEGSDGVVQAQSRVKDAHENTALAMQRLADSQAALQEAMKPKGGGGGGVDKLAEAMKKLTPAGREFATFMRAFVDNDLKKLGDAGQQAFLPGVQKGLQDLKPQLASMRAPFAEFSRVFGKAIGDTIPIIGQMGPAFMRFSTASLQGLAPLKPALQAFSTELGNVFTRMTNNGTASAAMTQLANMTKPLLELFPKLVEYGGKMMVALGPSLTELMQALGSALGDDILPAMLDAAPATADMISVLADLIGPLSQLFSFIQIGNPALKAFATLLGAASEWIQKLADKLGISDKLKQISDAQRGANEQIEGGVTPVQNLGSAFGEAAFSADRLRDAAKGVANGMLSARGAEVNYYEALDRATQSLKTNGATLDIHTTKGRQNRTALDSLATSSQAYIDKLAETGSSQKQLDAATDKSRAQLALLAQRFGMTKADAEKFAASVISIPSAKTVKITADTAAAMANLNNVKTTIASINGKTVTIRTVQETVYISSGGNTVIAKSKGGRIPGPASRTDSVPAILAQGEYVVNSEQTQRWLPLLESINAGSPVSSGALRAMGITGGAEPSGGGSGGGGGGSIVLELNSSGSGIDDWLVEILRRSIRVRGGNAQVVLGQGAAA